MVKIIVAFPSEAKCAQYAAALEEFGYSVLRTCTSASAVKLALNQCGDGIVLTSCRLPDSTVDHLAEDLEKRALILVTGRPAQLELCEHPSLFRLPSPCSKGELASAMRMLMQLYQMRLPHRSAEENHRIDQAKSLLMTRHAMTEPEAHHALQKGAMDKGMKLAEYAALLLRTL